MQRKSNSEEKYDNKDEIEKESGRVLRDANENMRASFASPRQDAEQSTSAGTVFNYEKFNNKNSCVDGLRNMLPQQVSFILLQDKPKYLHTS
jgi:hypothetical protein